MSHAIDAIFQRRAIKQFEPVEISSAIRQHILDAARLAPSSFNIQPYRFYWIETPSRRKIAAELCMSQKPAETASALVVAVADIGSWQPTVQGHLAWLRNSGQEPKRISEFEHRAKYAKWFFVQGWFGALGFLKWAILRIVHIWKTIGMAPTSRAGLFKWATKSASLACENLMIAAEALGLNTCPMEGFDHLRLARFLKLSSRYHEIVMVIAVGRKAAQCAEYPQWRRPLEATVTFL